MCLIKLLFSPKSDILRTDLNICPTDSVLSIFPGSDLEREFTNPVKEIDFKIWKRPLKINLKSSEEHITQWVLG